MPASYNMTDDVAIITGGAMGIGLACAQRLRSHGARICLWDIDQSALDEAKQSLSSETLYLRVDITNAQSVSDAMASTYDHFGKVTQLLNSAGITGPAMPMIDYTTEDWLNVINLNLNGTFFVNRAVVPFMLRNNYGRIVNIASIAGKEGNPNAAAYSASKAGVIGLTKSLGKELATKNIAVNCLTPAAAKTRIFEQMTQEHIGYMLAKIPRGRFVLTEEIAAMVCWLLSQENSFTTAGVFDLSGGRATY